MIAQAAIWLGRLLAGALAGVALTAAFAGWYDSIIILVDPELRSPTPSASEAVLQLLAVMGFVVIAAALVASAGFTKGASWVRCWVTATLSGVTGILVISVLYVIQWELPRDFGGRYLAFWVLAILVAIAIPLPLLLARRRPLWLALPLGLIVIGSGAAGDRLWFALELEYEWAPIYMLAVIGMVSGALSAAVASIPLGARQATLDEQP